MSVKRRCGVVAATAAVVCGSWAVAAPRAMAVSCWGDWCSGQDPMTSGCAADAETLAAVDADQSAGRLELRWSPTCKTAWARWEQFPRGWDLGSAPYELRTVQDTGYMQTLSYGDGVGAPDENTTTWTPMVYSPEHQVKAEALVSCGDVSLFRAAMDCAINGRIDTDMK
jgi:Protein of unknown function (DUF2690)